MSAVVDKPLATAALRSSATNDWGTPIAIVEMARAVMGGIDCDPCSSAYWNEYVVKAGLFYDEGSDPHPFKIEGWSHSKRWFINPPGGLVKEFWRFATERYREGSAVFWVGFNIGQLQTLQDHGLFFDGFVRCIPRRRLAYLKRVEGGPPVPGTQPPHASYLALLPSAVEQVERFRELARALPAEVF